MPQASARSARTSQRTWRPTPPDSAVAPGAGTRIVVLTETPAEVSTGGGTEVVTAAVLRELGTRGHEITVLRHPNWAGHGSPAPTEGTRMLMPPRDGGLEKQRFLWWVRRFREHPADRLVLVKGWFGAHTVALDAAARLCYPRYVTMEHHPAEPMPRRISRRRLGFIPGVGLWWYSQRASIAWHASAVHRVVTISDEVRYRLIELHHFDPARIRCVRFGIDVEAFRADVAVRARSRLRWGIPSGAVVVGALGRVERIKRFDVALRSFAAILHAQPALPLWFILAGAGEELEPLRELARTLRVADRVVFTGRVSDPLDAYAAIDVFVMPSELEGFGLSLLEAMASGCCSVVVDCGGPREILDDQSLGFLVPPGDDEAFAEALRQAVLLSPAERGAIGEAARESIARRFDAARQIPLLADAVLEA